jgi:transcription initiation factor TFIIE subunit alpha
MNMAQKLTQQLVKDTVSEAVGEDSLPIIEYLKDKKNISDFKIAEKVDKDIHEVRNILYRLYNQNLVSYYRKKDRQKGWYISYWTFNKKRIADVRKNLHKQKLDKYRQRLQQEEKDQGNFYICPNGCIRVNFEKATDLEFRCPECASLLNHQDNSKTIELLRTKLKEMGYANGHTNGAKT